MWKRDCSTRELPLPATANVNFQSSSAPRLGSVQAVEDERLSRLNAVAKDLFLRSIGSDEYYSIVEMTLENLLSTVKQRQSLVQGRAEEAAVNAVVIVVYCCCCCVGMLLCRHVIQAITTLIETHKFPDNSRGNMGMAFPIK
jgi:hypothetical protein